MRTGVGFGIVVLALVALGACKDSLSITEPEDGGASAVATSGLYKLEIDLTNLTAEVHALPPSSNGPGLSAFLTGTSVSVSNPTIFSKTGAFAVFLVNATITNNTNLSFGFDQNFNALQGIRTVFLNIAALPSGTARLSNPDGRIVEGPYVAAPALLLPGSSVVQTWGFEAPLGATSISAGFYITAETEIPASPQSGSVAIERLAGSSFPGFDDGYGADSRFNFPLGIAYDAFGDLVVADFANDAVRVIDGVSNVVRTVVAIPGPHDVAIGPDGDLFVVSFTIGRIFHVSFDGPGLETVTEIVSGLVDPTGIAVDRGGSLYVTEFGANRVRRYQRFNDVPASNPLAYGVPFTIAFINQPDGIVWDDATGTVFVGSRADTDIVQLVARGGGEISRRDTGVSPFGLDVDTAGGLFFVDGSSLRGISVDGNVVSISTGFLAARGVAVRTDGAVAVTEPHLIYLAHRTISSP